MLSVVLDFTSIFLAALLTGAMFCVWMILNPAHLDASHYTILQQQGIRTLHPVMPALGGISIALTLAAAYVARQNKPRMSFLIVTAVFFIISGVITARINMPINRSVIQWSSSAPPNNWIEFRDVWWHWHKLRAVSGAAGLALLIVANLLRDSETAGTLASFTCVRPLLNAVMQVMSFFL